MRSSAPNLRSLRAVVCVLRALASRPSPYGYFLKRPILKRSSRAARAAVAQDRASPGSASAVPRKPAGRAGRFHSRAAGPWHEGFAEQSGRVCLAELPRAEEPCFLL